MPLAVRALALVLAVVAAAALLLWLGQRRLLYFPERSTLDAAERRARAMGLEPWTVAGEVVGWREPRGGAVALLVLHGNAGSALDRGYFVSAFRSAGRGGDLDVRLLEYPGYGARPGAPGERSLLRATIAAVAALRAEGKARVLVAGESLGSAVAALAAAEVPASVDGLLLVTPLASVPAVAARHYGRLAALLVRDAYRADGALARYPGPVAFLVAGRDEVVFADLGRALHDARAGPKRLWLEPDAGHNTVDWDPGLPRWAEMVGFLLGP